MTKNRSWRRKTLLLPLLVALSGLAFACELRIPQEMPVVDSRFGCLPPLLLLFACVFMSKRQQNARFSSTFVRRECV